MSKLPTIVIVGRRNVGKSALFNRLIEKSKAIVSEIAGTTRDRTEGICAWRGTRIRVVDTGGLDVGDTNTIDREVKKQTRFAMKEADLILFLVDARVGPAPADKTLTKELRLLISPPARGGVRGSGSIPTTPSILLVANKSETAKWREAAHDPSWKRLGFDIPHAISALTGQGIGDLLDTIFTTLFTTLRHSERSEESRGSRGGIPSASSGQALRRTAPQDDEKGVDLRIAIIGKPNVGKSSLLNKILGEERVIVSEVPHTTREPQDTLITIPDPRSPIHLLLVDTAGIRRKAKITPGLEQAGVRKTLAAIKRSDVVIFVLDTTQPLDAQDKHLAQYIEEEGVGVIIAANKWDLLHGKPSPSPLPKGEGAPIAIGAGEGRTTQQGDLLMKQTHFGLPGLTFATVVFISALTGHSVQKLLPLALQVHENRKRVVPDEELKALLPKLIKHHKPPRAKGNTKHPVIRRIEQSATQPPTFTVAIGPKQSLHQTYLRFIENQLRNYFNFEGTPIKIWVKQEKN